MLGVGVGVEEEDHEVKYRAASAPNHV
jgi:hypothetical protein